MKRILYVSATYAPGALSGSELSAHTLLRELSRRRDADVRVVTDNRYTGGGSGEREYEGVTLVGAAHEDREQAIRSEVSRHRPFAILTQLIWSDVALRVGRELGVPTVFRIPSLPVGLEIGRGSPHEPTAILAPTPFVQEEIHSRFHRRAFLVRSAIDLQRALATERSEQPRYVTMFNPIDLKGGEVFRELARQMPEREFAAVLGWHSLRRPDGLFDPELFARSAESEGTAYDGYLPRDVDFSDLGNFTWLTAREAVHEIYAVTRVLVVPSLWAEVTGRVAIEAFANGIPVVASAVGGLADHVGRAGVLVYDYREPRAWVDALRSLDDARLYAECAERGRLLARSEFSLDRSVSDFVELLDRIEGLPTGALLDAR